MGMGATDHNLTTEEGHAWAPRITSWLNVLW